MPAGKCTSSSSSVSGIIIAWYGMNIPNRKNAKTKSAPGNRHFERTNPFSEPRMQERIVAGIASLKLFLHARRELRPGLVPGVEREHLRQRPRVRRVDLGEALKLVTMRT